MFDKFLYFFLIFFFVETTFLYRFLIFFLFMANLKNRVFLYL